MKTSDSIGKLMPALINAQSGIGHAVKDAKNPHFKNNYATLESVIDATKKELQKNKIAVIQSPTPANTLVTRLVHESGEFLESEINLLLNKSDMQQLGSALTYARRYSLASMLNIAQEDDDGNHAAGAGENKSIASPKNDLLNPGDYVVPIGKKYKGKKLSEIGADEISGFLDWLNDDSKKKNKPLDGLAVEFAEQATKHLINIGFYPPDMSESEEIK